MDELLKLKQNFTDSWRWVGSKVVSSRKPFESALAKRIQIDEDKKEKENPPKTNRENRGTLVNHRDGDSDRKRYSQGLKTYGALRRAEVCFLYIPPADI